MKTNIQNLELLYIDIPQTWESQGVRTDGYHTLTERHFADGWRDVVRPEVQENERIGGSYYDETNNVLTYHIVTISQEEMNAAKLIGYNEKLQLAVADLRIRAKGMAIGKTGSNSYILAQVDFYQRKYENAISLNPVLEIDADLEAEGMRDFGLSLADFKALIISMYNIGKENENYLMCFIEQGRSAILTLMANEDWQSVDVAFELIENLKGITTIAEARLIKNQILELC